MKRYGKYLLERQLAIGGMAEVFLARQHGPAGFEKQLVIKRILPHFANDEQFIQMFLDEARTAARLNHPNIVQIYELGEIEDSYYIAMEYIRGESLAKMIRRLRQHVVHMPLHLAAKVIASVCAGLDYAHNFAGEDGQPLGLVHRDISPDNVLVSFDGAVKMIDFGIAKALDNESKTQAGSIKGKFCYMSPEQVTGRRLDRRSDIFSLGIVLHELTTLEKPFGSDADLMTVSAIVNDAPRSAMDIIEGYPAGLWDIISRALAKDRGQRYDNAHEMQIAIERFIHSRGEFLSDRDIGNYMKKLFSESVEQLDELREMASGLKSRILVPPKTQVAEIDPGGETRVADGIAPSEAATRAVPTLSEEEIAAAVGLTPPIDRGPSRTNSVPPPKRTTSIVGNREPSIPGIRLPPPTSPGQPGPDKPKSSALKWIVALIVLGGLGAGGWFGWQWWEAHEATHHVDPAPAPAPGEGAGAPETQEPGTSPAGSPPVLVPAAPTLDVAAAEPAPDLDAIVSALDVELPAPDPDAVPANPDLGGTLPLPLDAGTSEVAEVPETTPETTDLGTVALSAPDVSAIADVVAPTAVDTGVLPDAVTADDAKTAGGAASAGINLWGDSTDTSATPPSPDVPPSPAPVPPAPAPAPAPGKANVPVPPAPAPGKAAAGPY